MPKRVNHGERRESIAQAMWRIVDEQGWERATMREVAREAGVSLGHVQHYFTSRSEMLTFAMEAAAEMTSARVADGIAALPRPPHPRDVLAVVLAEMLPLQPETRKMSRMNAAYVLEALHDDDVRRRAGIGMRDGRSMVERLIRQAIADGQVSADRNPIVETDLTLALTGFAPLLEFGVIEPPAVLAAIDLHLDRLFSPVEAEHRE